MTSFRRLLSCLCALLLLAGVPAQARMAVAQAWMSVAHEAGSGAEDAGADARDDCHLRAGPAPTAEIPDHPAGPTDDCCGGAHGDGACGSTCACPATAPALASVAAPETNGMATRHAEWSSDGHAGHAGTDDGPPTPPPRG